MKILSNRVSLLVLGAILGVLAYYFYEKYTFSNSLDDFFGNEKLALKSTFDWDLPNEDVGGTGINPKALANDCIALYKKKMCNPKFKIAGDTVCISGPLLTESVNFRRPEFKDWVKKTGGLLKSAHEIDLCFGIYTQEFIDGINNLHKKFPGKYPEVNKDLFGRISIFLQAINADGSAYRNVLGSEVPAFNLGGLKP